MPASLVTSHLCDHAKYATATACLVLRQAHQGPHAIVARLQGDQSGPCPSLLQIAGFPLASCRTIDDSEIAIRKQTRSPSHHVQAMCVKTAPLKCPHVMASRPRTACAPVPAPLTIVADQGPASASAVSDYRLFCIGPRPHAMNFFPFESLQTSLSKKPHTGVARWPSKTSSSPCSKSR